MISESFSKWKLNEKYKSLSESQKKQIEENIKSVVIRTQKSGDKAANRQYSGNNPPYLTPAATSFLRKVGILNILVDLPSIDREEDAGMLAAHCAFWNFDKKSQRFIGENSERKLSSEPRTVTELCNIPESIRENELYLLDLQISPFIMDAAPSRPLLFPISIKE